MMKVAPPASQPDRPAHSVRPHSAIDDRNPTSPSAISTLRPRLSDWRAQRCRKAPAEAAGMRFLEPRAVVLAPQDAERSEEHTSELQSLMRISYAVFCLKKK